MYLGHAGLFGMLIGQAVIFWCIMSSCFVVLTACGSCAQLGTHLRGKRKREELSALLRKAKK